MRYVFPDDGTPRTKKWFAFLPVEIGRELRWFEFVSVYQRYNNLTMKWENYHFVDKGEQSK